MQPKNPDLLGLLQNKLAAPQSVIKGNGTGVSDDVPAIVKDRSGKPVARALLSEGEFVIKADVVSKLGGGATDPGVRFLDEFQKLVSQMDRDSAVTFAEMVLTQAELLLDDQPKIEDTE